MRLVSSKPAGKRRVYDIEIADDHNFFANGINVHNCTGLPIPTIAVATDGGVSVIKDDGNVWDITGFSSDGDAVRVAFMPKSLGGLWVTGSYNGGDQGLLYQFNALPTADIASSAATKIYLNSGTGPTISSAYSYYLAPYKNGGIANGGAQYLDLFTPNYATPASGMKAQISTAWNTGWMPGDIRGAWLADTVAETVTGTELVTNGTFATDTTGWTGSNATLSVVSAAMRLTAVASAAMSATQAITCVVGKSYVAAMDVTAEASTGTMALAIGTSSGGTETGTHVLASGAGKLLVNFVATATTHYISAYGSAATLIGETFDVDNISCRLADVDRSVKAKGLQAFGSLTKAAVASGAALMGYSGFSAANYLEQPYNSDLDFGTGDFCIMGWVYLGGYAGTNHTILHRCLSGSTGGLLFMVASTGEVLMFATNGTGYATSVGSAAGTMPTAGWVFLAARRSGTTLSVHINAVSMASGTVSGNLTYANAVTRVGLRMEGTYPHAGSLALLRATATAPSDEQLRHIYETERPMFEANAQCCLAGTSNAVTALAYDEETDLLHVGTSYGRSAFKGLVRTSSEATPVGAITALSAGAGIVVQGGATAVDVYVPAYTLREELLRDAEQMAKFGQNLIAHDFTATASQEVFTLPVGWEIVAVYQQGTLKRETTAWVRTFDGFKWSVDLVTGATVSDWISILAKRV